MSERFFGLIPAAGGGTRFGGGTPKQYLALAGRTMLEHAAAALLGLREIERVLVVVSAGDSLHRQIEPRARLAFAAVGGATRAASVRSGLAELAAAERDWVLVHDAARPCVSNEELRKLIEALRDDDVGGLLAIPLADTLKRERNGRCAQTLDRTGLWRAATPQMFRAGVLRRALDAAAADAEITDEAAAVERLGLEPRLVEGFGTNIKVTLPADAALAEAILRARG
ncbi:MAG TPA: 2-C-methyl-D-erythritol 4-phosphate cytidylyltransferase [Burkholderiaceae bacterium]|nr:2-C-methyl-D-erythritol 4-phosphate cytidylyltransferase [Burkholderiaceae bacterium]